MNYEDDANENSELPAFGPLPPKDDLEEVKKMEIPKIDKEEILKENNIPIYDASNEAQYALAGLTKASDDSEWEIVDDLESAQHYGIVFKRGILFESESFHEAVEAGRQINWNFSTDSPPDWLYDFLKDTVHNLAMESGDSVQIDNSIKREIDKDEYDFARGDSVNEHFEELKLQDRNIYIRPETLERINAQAADPELINSNIGQSFPPGSRSTHFGSGYVEHDTTQPYQQPYQQAGYSQSPHGPETIQHAAYRQNMAEIGNGAVTLVGGAASLIGGGASLTGVLADKAGSLLKSVTQKILNRSGHASSSPTKDASFDNASFDDASFGSSLAGKDGFKGAIITPDATVYQLENNERGNAKPHSPDRFMMNHLEQCHDDYLKEIQKFWSHEKIKPIKEQIETLAHEQGISVSDMRQKVEHEPDYAYLRNAIQGAVASDDTLSKVLKDADANMDDWLETYEILKDKQERIVHPEAAQDMDDELGKQQKAMEDAVGEAPPGTDHFSKLEEFKMRIKEIVEKIREMISKLMPGNSHDVENSPTP